MNNFHFFLWQTVHLYYWYVTIWETFNIKYVEIKCIIFYLSLFININYIKSFNWDACSHFRRLQTKFQSVFEPGLLNFVFLFDVWLSICSFCSCSASSSDLRTISINTLSSDGNEHVQYANPAFWRVDTFWE